MFIAVLLIIAKTWKQPRYTSADKWLNKLWYIQTMEYYPVLRRNVLSSPEKIWRNLKCILINERSPSEKATHHMIPTIQHSEKGKIMETVKRSVVASKG